MTALRPTGWPLGVGEVRWGVAAAIFCLLGAQIFAVVWGGAAISAVYGTDDLPVAADRPIWTLLVFNGGLWIGYFVGPLLAKRLTDSPLVDFDLRADGMQILMAIVIGIGAQLALLPALYWLLLQFISGDPGQSAEALLDRVDGPLDVALLVLAVVLIAPIVEEWFYRGMLLATLARRIGVIGAAVVSSVVFALVHQDLIVMPGLFCLALILSWLTMRTARIGPAIVAHMAFNATTVIQLLLL